MLQPDYRDLAVSSPGSVYRSDAQDKPLWVHGWRALFGAAQGAGRLVPSAIERLRRWQREAVTVRELSALRDKELRDIGIEREDIRSVARSMAHSEEDPQRAREGRPRAEISIARTLRLVPRQEPALRCCG